MMTDQEKSDILTEYEEIERLYRLYTYAKETADMYLKKYINRLQSLPLFKAPHQKIMRGINENK